MSAVQLLANFDRLAEAPGAVPRLRRFILDLAVRGKLVEQDAGDEPAAELLKRIQAEKRKGDKRQIVEAKFAATDTQFVVPKNWISVPLISLGSWAIGAGFPKNEQGLRDGEYFFLKVSDMNLPGNEKYITTSQNSIDADAAKRMRANIHPAGTIIFPKIGGAIATNKRRILTKGSAIDNNCLGITFSPEIDGDWAYLLLTFLNFTQYQVGTAVPALQQAILERIAIGLPPLAEQHRIVAKVDELMTLCDQLEAAQQERERCRDRLASASLQRLNQPAAANPATDQAEAAEAHQQAQREQQKDHARFHLQNLNRLTIRPEHIKAMRATIFNLAVRGLLVSQRAHDESASDLFTNMLRNKAQLARLGAIPKEKIVAATAAVTFPLPSLWVVVRLGEICNLVTSGSRGWAEFYAKSGPKFLRAQNIRFGRLRLDDLACVNPPVKSEGLRTQVRTGDLLIVITGAGVTNPALLDSDIGEAYVSQHVALVRPSSPTLSRWLLLCLMAGPSGRDELIQRAYGAGKPGLNLDNIRSLNTPLPPLAEQHRIVAKVDELMALCDQLEAQLTQSQTDSRRLLEAVLEAAIA